MELQSWCASMAVLLYEWGNHGTDLWNAYIERWLSLPGWTVSHPSIGQCRFKRASIAHTNSISVYWSGDNAVLSQPTQAIAGRRYLVTFWTASFEDTERFTVTFGDLDVTVDPTDEFIKYSYTATAFGNDILTFTGFGGVDDADIDRVTIVEAP